MSYVDIVFISFYFLPVLIGKHIIIKIIYLNISFNKIDVIMCKLQLNYVNRINFISRIILQTHFTHLCSIFLKKNTDPSSFYADVISFILFFYSHTRTQAYDAIKNAFCVILWILTLYSASFRLYYMSFVCFQPSSYLSLSFYWNNKENFPPHL